MDKQKRRRPVDVPTNTSAVSSDDNGLDQAQSLFRQHFESIFEPIETKDSQSSNSANSGLDECLLSSESDWDGLSEDDESEKPTVVIQDSSHRSARPETTKEELRRYMVRGSQGILFIVKLTLNNSDCKTPICRHQDRVCDQERA